MQAKILLVDDDQNLLSSMKRQLRKGYDITTAASGEEALDYLKTATRTGITPAVVVCDMRMGGMDGVQTLSKIRDISPDTVRIMLTGNADMQTAIDAINSGHIFRFLTKPCLPEVMQSGLDDAIKQYQLVTAERELLEKTLAGSVKVLIDMLAMASPLAFRRATQVRTWVRKVAPALKLTAWQLEISAMLGPIGLLSVPAEVLQKHVKREALSAVEQQMLDRSPESAKNIISNIPRLASVANTVYLQNKGFDGSGFPKEGPKGLDIPIEARVLKVLNGLADITTDPQPNRFAFVKLNETVVQYDAALVDRIRNVLEVPVSQAESDRQTVELEAGVLLPGMILAADIVAEDGRLVLSAMMQVSAAHVESIRNLARLKRIKDRILVFEDEATKDAH